MYEEHTDKTDSVHVKPATKRKPWHLVWLRCSKCQKKKLVHREYHDPAEAHFVQFQCPDCNPNGFENIEYFDKAGEQVIPEWAK